MKLMADGTVEAPLDWEHPELVQDFADGFALRRLREALPDDAVGFEVGAWVRREDDPQYPGWGFRIDAEWWTDDEPRFHSAHGRGATIAEAADKCREALTSKGEDK